MDQLVMLGEDEDLAVAMLFKYLGKFPYLRDAVIGYVPGSIPGKQCFSGSRVSAAPHDQLLKVCRTPDGEFDSG